MSAPSSLTWIEIRARILGTARYFAGQDRGDAVLSPVLVQELLALTDAERVDVYASLTAALKGREPELLAMPWSRTAAWRMISPQRAARALMVVVACAPSAASAATAMTRSAMRPGFEVLRPEPLSALAAPHGAAWQADLGTRLAQACRVNEEDRAQFDHAWDLLLAAGAPVPVTAATVGHWFSARREAVSKARGWVVREEQGERLGLAQAARQAAQSWVDLPGSDGFITGALEIDEASNALGEITVGIDAKNYAPTPLIIAALVEVGYLSRAELVPAVVSRLVRGGTNAQVRPVLALAKELDLSPAEAGECAADLVALLDSRIAGVPAWAQRALHQADDAGKVDADLVLQAVERALMRDEKVLSMTAVKHLVKAHKKGRVSTDAALVALAEGFRHTRIEVAEAALREAAEWVPQASAEVREQVRGVGLGVEPALVSLAAQLLGMADADAADEVHDDVVDAPVADVVEPMPEPWMTPESVRQFFDAVILTGRTSPADLTDEVTRIPWELGLAALVSVRYRDPAGVAAALADLDDPPRWMDQGIARLLLEAKNPKPRQARRGLLGRLLGLGEAVVDSLNTSRSEFQEREWEVLQLIEKADVPALVSTPTHRDLSITPEVLLARLTEAATQGWGPGPHDLQWALLRLRLPHGQEAIECAAQADLLGTAAGSALAAWVREGGVPAPHTELVRVDTHRGRPLDDGAGGHRLQARLHPRREPRTQLERELFAHDGVAHVRGTFQPIFANAAGFPGLAPDVMAAHLLSGGVAGDWLVVPFEMAALTRASGLPGPASAALLVRLVTSDEQHNYPLAVDLLLAWPEGEWLEIAGQILASAAAEGLIVAQRATAPLSDAVAAGAPSSVLTLVSAALPGLLGTGVRGTPAFLETAVRALAHASGSRRAKVGSDQRLREALVSSAVGKTRVAVESRRLLEAIS